MCEWTPNLTKANLESLLKDKYEGCSFNLNNNLFDFASLVYEYDKESYFTSVWIDIGANQGEFSKYVADIDSNAIIYAFEPFEPVFKSLQWTMKDYTNVKLLNIAISNTTESNIPFYTQLGRENDVIFDRSSLEKLHDDYYIYQYINTSTLYDFYTENGKKELFFIKIDTEGFDGIILKNSLNLFMKKKIKYLYFEYNKDWETVDSNLTWKSIVKEITNCGYNVYLDVGNVIYMNEYFVDYANLGGNKLGFCFNFIAIKRGLKYERNIFRRLCPKCGY